MSIERIDNAVQLLLANIQKPAVRKVVEAYYQEWLATGDDRKQSFSICDAVRPRHGERMRCPICGAAGTQGRGYAIDGLFEHVASSRWRTTQCGVLEALRALADARRSM